MVSEIVKSGLSPYRVAIELLELWGRRPSAYVGAVDDPGGWDTWTDLVQAVVLRSRHLEGAIGADDARWINEAANSSGLGPYDMAHAVAWGIDEALWSSFTASWTEEIEVASGPHMLREGDWFPVSDWLPDPPRGQSYSTRPCAQPFPADELPHVRRWHRTPLAGYEAIDVVIHLGMEPEIDSIAECAVVASVHPNDTDNELNFPNMPQPYPIGPRPQDQSQRIVTLVRRAVDSGSELVVAPELCTNRDVLSDLQQWTDEDPLSPAVLVAGSVHEDVAGEPANVAYAFVSGRPPLLHRKISPFSVSKSRHHPAMREGIVGGRRELHVWQGTWARFAMLICRDFLDPSLRLALARVGTNLVVVPSFTSDMDVYVTQVGALANAIQGRVIVVNGPPTQGSSVVGPAAVFGQPVGGRSSQILPVPVDGSVSRGVGLDEIGSSPVWSVL